MISRSPRLRQQFFIYCMLLFFCIYMFSAQSAKMEIFPIKIIVMSIYGLSFPIIFNQFLFSAESSFFDRLMITPNFEKILSAKYLLYVFFTFPVYLALLCINPLNWQSFIELTAIFLYSIGTITLLSFSSMLFVDKKMDLFGSHYKMIANTQSVQTLAILLTNILSIGLVVLISWLFSSQITVYFMMITGGLFILLYQKWFSFLYRCFFAVRHKKMELFRIQ